jgi:predicted HNH restriction endonuclease
VHVNNCMSCGYGKHIEVCHLRQITDFPDTATVDEVNDLSNLTVLCPNCHWEFDNGLISVRPLG